MGRPHRRPPRRGQACDHILHVAAVPRPFRDDDGSGAEPTERQDRCCDQPRLGIDRGQRVEFDEVGFEEDVRSPNICSDRAQAIDDGRLERTFVARSGENRDVRLTWRSERCLIPRPRLPKERSKARTTGHRYSTAHDRAPKERSAVHGMLMGPPRAIGRSSRAQPIRARRLRPRVVGRRSESLHAFRTVRAPCGRPWTRNAARVVESERPPSDSTRQSLLRVSRPRSSRSGSMPDRPTKRSRSSARREAALLPGPHGCRSPSTPDGLAISEQRDGILQSDR